MKHNKYMKTNKLKKITFLIPFSILLFISLAIMYHAKFITNTYASHFKKQLLWYIIGILIIFLFKKIKIKKLFDYSFLFYLMNIGLLILVLFIGSNINGAKAWIDLKYFNLQPSELMKLSYSLFLAKFISKKKLKNKKEELLFLIEILGIFLIPSFLVFLEPDTGAIIFYGAITLVLLWNSTLRKRWFLIIGIFLTIFICGFFYCYFLEKNFLISILGTSFFYRMDRLLNFREGMQIEHALIAIGSADFLKFSLTKTGIYIPESPTDFAFALTSNVFGLFGNIMIIICFFLLDWWFINDWKTKKKKEEKLFYLSFITIFLLSQIINISMNLGIFPIIGIPLPFISYGGSSTIVLFLYLAIIFSSKQKKKTHRV